LIELTILSIFNLELISSKYIIAPFNAELPIFKIFALGASIKKPIFFAFSTFI